MYDSLHLQLCIHGPVAEAGDGPKTPWRVTQPLMPESGSLTFLSVEEGEFWDVGYMM